MLARQQETSLRTDDEKQAVVEPIVMENKAWEWATAFAIYTALFIFMLEHHRWRGKPYSLSTANKAMAIELIALYKALGAGWDEGQTVAAKHER